MYKSTWFHTLILSCAALLASVAAVGAQNFPSDSTTLEITTCQTTLFDPGGPDDNYPDGSDGYVQICPDGPPGSVIQLKFISFATELDFDSLIVYNGPNENAPKIAVLDGGQTTNIITATSPGGCLFLRFKSDSSFTAPGFEIEAVCIASPDQIVLSPEGGQIEVCNALLFDTGGPENPYQNNENWEYTICPSEPGNYVRLNAEAMNLEVGDNLTVFNGSDFDQLIARAILNDASLDVVSRSPDGCLSIRFASDDNIALEGFQLYASCEEDPGPSEPTDCINAVSICRAVYTEEFQPRDEGFAPNEIDTASSCLKQGEKRGIWYRFTVLEAGKLGFVITPANELDDYDWALFNITNASCEEIFDNPDLEISCNYNERPGETGMTEDGVGDANGQGEDQSKFNRLYDVSVGEEFVLYVSSFTSNLGEGYTVDFSRGGGDADVFDPNIPEINAVFNCDRTTVVAEFSELALCSAFSPDSVRLTDGERDYPIAAVLGPGCISSNASRTLRITLAEPLPIGRELTLTFAPGALADDCQNANTDSVSFAFTTVAPLGFRSIAKRNTFGGDNNGAVFLSGAGGAPPYFYSIDELFFDTPRQFRELFPQPYTVYIEDSRGCRFEREVVIR